MTPFTGYIEHTYHLLNFIILMVLCNKLIPCHYTQSRSLIACVFFLKNSIEYPMNIIRFIIQALYNFNKSDFLFIYFIKDKMNFLQF